jgi:cell wall-associated protease
MKAKVLIFSLLFLVIDQGRAAHLAIIDSGIDYKHKDLAARMWTNPNSETKTDDGTVYKDDNHGWNFAEKNNQIIDYKYLGTFSSDCPKMFAVQGKILTGKATEEEKAWYKSKKEDQTFLKELMKFGNFVHGSHVSGISSKDAPKSQLIGLKLIPTETPGIGKIDPAWVREARVWSVNRPDTTNPLVTMFLGLLAKQQAKLLIETGQYTKATGGEVANGSFGTSVAAVKPLISQLLSQFLGHEPSEQETKDYSVAFVNQIIDACKDFVASAPSTLFVFAAGNDGTNNDELPTSPANIKTENTIAVAATWGVSSLATFSNYGDKMVEVAAPGVVINSTIPGDQYMELSGTSMAAPFVTNVAGLVKDANPAFGVAEIKRTLMETVDVKDFLKGKVKTSGIVNRHRAVQAARLARTMSLDSALRQARVDVRDMGETAVDRSSMAHEDLLVLPLPSWF